MTAALEQLAQLVRSGGAVMPPLAAVGVVVWYLLVRRWQRLRTDPVPAALAELRAAPHRRRAIVIGHQQRLAEGAALIRGLCRAAPLLGLLGTVAGMVETFASLTGVQGVSGEGTVAGGIAQALITTQMGLVVAIPAVVAARLLDARAARLRGRLLELGELGGPTRAEPPREEVARP